MPAFRPLSIALLASAALIAAPVQASTVGFVVNSDDPSPRDFDSLYRVDLETGQSGKIGEVRSTDSSPPFADIEGLAFNTRLELFGIDDASKSLIRIDTRTGRATVLGNAEGNTGLQRNSNYDFGLAFDCQNVLYASSDSRRTLYRLDSATGNAVAVGGEGALGAPITDIAFRNNVLYGIGSEGSENLYRIDVSTGRAELVGPLGAGLRFNDGGLSVDSTGRLWGVADMTGSSTTAEPSVVFRINEVTGAATRISTTVAGVESLAITAPFCRAPEGNGIPAISTISLGGKLSLIALILLGLVWARPFRTL